MPLVTVIHLHRTQVVVVDHNPWSATTQPIPEPLSDLSIKFMSLCFKDEDVMWGSVKWFAQIQVGDISCISLIHQNCNLIIEGHQNCQAKSGPVILWHLLLVFLPKEPVFFYSKAPVIVPTPSCLLDARSDSKLHFLPKNIDISFIYTVTSLFNKKFRQ